MRGVLLDGRYRLKEPVGSGGMGRVWLAEDERIGRTVAVKVLSQPDEDTAVTRFTREARVVGGLSSPHIVTLHDFGEARVADERVLYLVMEHLRGRDLGAVLEKRKPDPVPPAEVIDWALAICAGLETAHRADIVHRDIKPANVLLTSEGAIKILDFGIARMLSTAGPLTRTDLTATGFVIGTPLYMSPEQIVTPDTIDSRSDLYSLGCLLHALLTGVPPFTGTGTSVLAQHLRNTPRPPSERRAELAGYDGLDALVLRLLAKEPDERPADAAEVSALLKAARAAGAAGTAGAAEAVVPPAPVPPDPVPEPEPARAPFPEPDNTPTALGSVAHAAAPPSTPSPPQQRHQQVQPPSYPYPLPPGQPTAQNARLRIGGRSPRIGSVSTRTVAATWLAGAGTALVTGVLLLLCVPTQTGSALVLSGLAGLAGMAATHGFTNVFDPRERRLFDRLLSALLLAFPLGAGGAAIDHGVTGRISGRYVVFAGGACLAALTVGVLIADQLVMRLRLPPRAALLLTMSGWINGVLTWAMLAHLSALGPLWSLPIGCAVWLGTAAGLGRILSPATNPGGTHTGGTAPGGGGPGSTNTGGRTA
ncbi:serine/threonine-protein kinase [Streptomyces sp. NPDC059783]|uniref:serine/threonine-protein kinase n=1 Tax=Streptomyces sp. NPDC059783 TaxID=3346944 RepID=UPI0036599965